MSERVSSPTTVVTNPCKAAGTRAACVGATNRPRRAAWNTASGVLNTRAARGALIVASTNSRVASSLTSVAPAARMYAITREPAAGLAPKRLASVAIDSYWP